MDRPRAWNLQAIDLAAEPKFRVGGATIDPVSRDAVFAGGSERLQPQNLKVLTVLARRRGEVVTRADLVDLCWDGRIVGEDVINHAISVLRTFAARAGGFTIETVPKAGYRLIESDSPRPTNRKWLGVLGLCAVLVAAASLLYAVRDDKQGDPPVPTVAILPLDAPAGDRAGGEIARATRVSLSHMLSEGGFPVRLADTPDARPDFVISGDIERQPGQVHALIRMEESKHHTVIFTHHFAAPVQEAAGLPDQVGASVATNLSWTAALMVLDRRHPTDPVVMSELLQQMSITVEGGDILRAYQLARRIVAKAPDSAIAQVALAFDSGFALGDLPREQRPAAVALGRQAAERATALAPNFGDTYATWCFLHSFVRLAECEDHIRLGMRMDPDAPFTTAFLNTLLSDTGRAHEALDFARAAIANDPFKPFKLGRLILALEVLGQTKEADSVYDRASRWWPGHGGIRWQRLQGLIEHGDFDAIEELATSDSELASSRNVIRAARSRDPVAVRRACAAGADQSAQMLCLVVLADVGEMDAAYSLATRLYPSLLGRTRAEEERIWLDNPGGYPAAILSAPSAAALRRDPRFIGLASGQGLVAYWRNRHPPDFCSGTPEPICARLLG